MRVRAKPEPVLTVTAATAIDLMLATYHLGNRHVPLEVTDKYLRLAPDAVLQEMLVTQLGVTVVEEIAPFCPLAGAYQHSHGADHDSHAHSHAHNHDHGHTRDHEHHH